MATRMRDHRPWTAGGVTPDTAAMARSMNEQQARWTPPPWLNRLMTRMLRTPGLQRVVGRGTALLTFTGRRTGRTYTTPVSYAREGDRVIIVGHVSRTWWRNLTDRPAVGLRLAGTDRRGTARVLTAEDDEALDLLGAYLRQQRMAARAQRVRRDDAGGFWREDLERVLAESVVVDVRLGRS